MDSKATNNLDPKLKEAYERIMGTAVLQTPQTQTTPAAPPAQPQTSQQPTATSPTPSKPADFPPSPPPPAAPKLQVQEVVPEPLTISTPDLPFPPKLVPVSNEMVQSPQSPVFNSKKNPFIPEPIAPQSNIVNTTSAEALNPKKKGKLMPIVLTLGGLVFFVLYGVIWAKVFGLF